MALLTPAVHAESAEPQIYLFWSASCPYSKAARTFLEAAQAKDPHLRIRDFEVDESIANTTLLGRLFEKIGIRQLSLVPVVVVGHHVVIGYIDDESTGAEILRDVAECRKTGCKDTVRELIEEGSFERVAAAPRKAQVECGRSPGRAIR
jgi:glutaredoxin